MSTLLYLTAASVTAGYVLARAHASTAAYSLVPAIWVIYVWYRVFVYPFYISPLRHLPEPDQGSTSLPFSHARLLKDQPNGSPFRQWRHSPSDHGMMRIRVLFNQERLFLTSPEAIKEMTVTRPYEFAKPPHASFLLRSLIGNGVLVAEGSEHQRQRKALQPAFSYRHVKELYPLFWSKARQSAEEIAKEARASATSTQPLVPVKAYEWASRATLDIIGVAGMGHDFDSVGHPDGEIVTVYRALFEDDPPFLKWVITGIAVPVKWLWHLPIPSLRDAKTAANVIRDFAFKVVKQKRAALEKEQEGMLDILSVAMRSGQFTDADVVDQMMTFLAAGHETTASALTWAIYQMCSHPEMQQRLREEVRASLPSIRDVDATVTAAEIDKLPYLNAFCNEVLRVIPSVPLTVRDALVDTHIQGQFIPKGTRCFLVAWATNVTNDLWGDSAMEFDPERWLGAGMANSGGATNNFANLTFLHGPRSCIGKDFAKSEFMCLLAAWIGRFRVRWESDEPLPMDIMGTVTLKPAHKLPVIFEEIEGW